MVNQSPKASTAGSGSAPATPAATSGGSATGRLFGELLVEEKLITPAQLETALRRQAGSPTYLPIGQVLLADKLITRKQLNALLQRHRKRSRLGAILVKAGRITAAQLEEALTHQRRSALPIGETLIRLGYVSETTMRDALCTQLHINFFDLDPIAIDRSLARLISERFATRHLICPLFRIGKILVVAMDDPSKAALIEELRVSLGLQIEVVTASAQKLKAALGRLYGPTAAGDVDVFGRRNILIGPVRDPAVAELAARVLPGVSLLPPGWQ